MRRIGRAAYWITPSLFCLLVYWPGLTAWFHQDDFAWLGLRLSIYTSGDLWTALFEPQAQGTIRFLSERAFFLVFESIFGINPFPFHVWVFLTQIANLILLSTITRRLTGSRTAGFWAPVLWTAGTGLAIPLSWIASYNEILFCFFLLLTFYFLLRYIETGQRRYYAAQWMAFLLGFGAQELNVVYPALAALFTYCCARKHLRKTLPLFVVSAAYTVLHMLVAPQQTTGPYALHYDWKVFSTLWTYWKWTMGPARLPGLFTVPIVLVRAGTGLLTLSLLGFAIWKIRRREWLAIFFLGWFGIVILPLLPLRDHITEYYAIAPSLGLAMLAGWALGQPWGPWLRPTTGFGWGRPLCAVLAGIYLASSLPVTISVARRRYEYGRLARNLVEGVVEAHQIHPRQLIILKGVNHDLFWEAVYDDPFRLYGIPDVYLAPGSEAAIQGRPELTDLSRRILPGKVALRALDRDEAVLYEVRGERLTNITAGFLAQPDYSWTERTNRRLDVANPVFADQLGPGWYPAENGFRWMSRSASARLGGPVSAGQKLYVAGYVAAVLLGKGPVELAVSINGAVLKRTVLAKPDSPFELGFALPNSLIGNGDIEVFLKVNRTTAPPQDPRELGLTITSFEIR